MLNPPLNPQMPFKLDPRVSVRDTAYRLNYALHVIDTEADEVESAITEEEPHHPNIDILAMALKHLADAETSLKAAIELFEPPKQNEPNENQRTTP